MTHPPRVAVTTTVDRYDEVAGALSVAGCEPVALPCIEVVFAEGQALDEIRVGVAHADIVVLTSQRPISLVWPDGMTGVKVLAVGDATADTARAAGASVVGIGKGGGLALAKLFGDKVAGQHVVYPHAGGGSNPVEKMLAHITASFTSFEVYRVDSVAPADDEVDAAMFASPSAVRSWAAARDFDSLITAAIGDTTASALAEHGVVPNVIPDSPGMLVLVSATAKYLLTQTASKTQIPSKEVTAQ